MDPVIADLNRYLDAQEAYIEAEETAEQEERYTIIAKQMDDLEPQREKWYQEFFDRITTWGFNFDNDTKVKIKPEELPVKPKGLKDKVLWKYGVDDE